MERNEVNLLREFNNNQDNYRLLEEEVTSRINEIIKTNDFFIMDIQHRVKTNDSLEGKLIRKSGKYKSIYEITDLVGFRIICYFEDTVDKIAEALSKVFILDKKNSVDKRATLQTTQFGYLSLHYICRLPPTENYPEDILKIPFEIQIRTVLQHAWAEIEHDLGYKSSFGVPKPIRRDFSRIAGLLEIADREFINLRDNSKRYTEEIIHKIQNDEGSDITIDRISLSELINKSKAFNHYISLLKEKFSIDIEFSEINQGYLEQLEWLEVETIGDFMKLFEENQDFVSSNIKNLVENFGIDIITSSAILRMICEGHLIRDHYSDTQIIKYLKLENSQEDYINRNLKRIAALRK